MSTKTTTLTRCDGPGCDATNRAEECTIEGGWAVLERTIGFGDARGSGIYRRSPSNLDFCSVFCVSKWAESQLERKPKVTA